MTCNPFSVIVIPFPFTDSNKTKTRPALVVNTEKHQSETGHLTLLMITSAYKKNPWFGDHIIIDLKSAGLPVKSAIRQKIFTIDARLFIKKIGDLSTEDIDATLIMLKKHITTTLKLHS